MQKKRQEQFKTLPWRRRLRQAQRLSASLTAAESLGEMAAQALKQINQTNRLLDNL